MIGVDRGQQQRVIDLCAGLVWLHDAGIVDEHVHIGVLGDQLVAALVQCLGERAADAGASASDEDGVACENPASMALRAALA